jgi:hypothetical protein
VNPLDEIVPVENDSENSLLDLVDHLLQQGVVITGDVVLGLSNIDLIYLRASVLLCAADRVLPADGER